MNEEFVFIVFLMFQVLVNFYNRNIGKKDKMISGLGLTTVSPPPPPPYILLPI